MRLVLAAVVCLAAQPLWGCADPVCEVPGDALRFTRTIDFDDLRTSLGIGTRIDTVLGWDGVQIGERFAGQTRAASGTFDMITGTPFAPLMVIDGGPGQTLGTMHLQGSTVLHGHGPKAYPRVEAVGEGAIAILFDRDQPALAFDVRGGELGTATVHFLRRDGSGIGTVAIGPLTEGKHVFQRKDLIPDIAGVLLLNTDPQGLSIDNLRFESADIIG